MLLGSEKMLATSRSEEYDMRAIPFASKECIVRCASYVSCDARESCQLICGTMGTNSLSGSYKDYEMFPDCARDQSGTQRSRHESPPRLYLISSSVAGLVQAPAAGAVRAGRPW